MRLERRAWLLLLFAVPLLAVACGDDGIEPPTPLMPKEEPPVPTAATADQELLESMVLSAEEVREVFPGSGEWSVYSVPQWPAGWAADYTEVTTGNAVSTVLSLYETAEDASNGFAEQTSLDLEVGPGVEITEFDAGDIGNEAGGQVNRTPEVYTFVRLRVDRVFAGITLMLGRTDDDRQEEALQLARMLAEKIEARLQE
jgi:hypothetical protein